MSRTRMIIVWCLAALAVGATVGLALLTAYGDPDHSVEAGAQAALLWVAPMASGLFLLSTLRGRPMWVAVVLVPIAVAAVWVGWGSHLWLRAEVSLLGESIFDNHGPAGLSQGIATFYSSVFGLLAGLVIAALATRWGGWYPLLWWAGTVPWAFLWALVAGSGQQFGEFPRLPLSPPPPGIALGTMGLLPVLAFTGWGHATRTKPVWPPVGFAATSAAFGISLFTSREVVSVLSVIAVAWAAGLYLAHRRWERERARREVAEGTRS